MKTLSERPLSSLTDDFNAGVWRKIQDLPAQDPQPKPLVFSWRPGPLWGGAIAAALVTGSVILLRFASSDSQTNPGLSNVRGEVIDLACYYDDGGSGPAHVACAKRCILAGLPVGIKTEDGRVYLLIGPQMAMGQLGPKHQSLNEQLASYAAQVVTIRGSVVEKQGLNVVENAQLSRD